MMDTKLESYRTTDTLGKSPVDLVIKVYDGAILAFKEANNHYQNDQSDEGYDELQKARKFVTHLYTTLDMQKGGDIARNLGKLYTLILTQTDIAQSTKDLELINTNITLLSNLRDGWIGLKDQQKSTSVPVASQTDHINTSI